MLEELEKKEQEKKEKAEKVTLRRTEKEKKKDVPRKGGKKQKEKTTVEDDEDDFNDFEVMSETDEEDENDEDAGENDEDENDEKKEKEVEDVTENFLCMEKTWSYLNPPTKECDVVGKWFACIYDTKRGPNLFIGKALTRFLYDENGHAAGVEIDCLQQKLGTVDSILRETKNVTQNGRTTGEDVDTFAAHNVICGPLKAEFLGGNKWEFPQYPLIRTLFERVKKMNREAKHLSERSKWHSDNM